MAGSSITMQKVRDLQNKAQSALTRANNLKANVSRQLEQATETVVQSLEVGGTAFGFGMATGYTGGVEVLGVPLDLGMGIALHSLGLFVEKDHVADHLHNFGDGCMAAYLHTLGLGIGRRWAQEAGAAQAATALPPAAAHS